MGAFQSNIVKQVAETINKQVTNQTVNVINTAQNTCSALQNSTVYFGVPATSGNIGCDFQDFGKELEVDIKHTLDQQCNLTQEASTVLQSEMKSIIENSIRSTLEQKTDAVQKFLALSFGFQSNYSDQINRIVNEVLTNIDLNATNNCTLSALINQNGGVVFCGSSWSNKKVTITQNAAQIATGYCIANAIFNTVINNEYLNAIVTKADQQAYIEQGTDVTLIIIIVVVIIVVLLAIALGIYFGLYYKKKKTDVLKKVV